MCDGAGAAVTRNCGHIQPILLGKSAANAPRVSLIISILYSFILFYLIRMYYFILLNFISNFYIGLFNLYALF